MAENALTLPNSQVVLVAIDGSVLAEQALDFYLDNLYHSGHSVLLLHCEEPLHVIGESPSAEVYQKAIEDGQQKAKQLEETYTRRLREKNVPCRTMSILANKPGEAIVETAEKEGVMMVVLGTRGLGTVRRTLLGSVSDFVSHHAPCPVIICRQHAKPPSSPADRILD